MKTRTFLSLLVIVMLPILIGFLMGGRRSNERETARLPDPTEVNVAGHSVVSVPHGTAVRIGQYAVRLIESESSMRGIEPGGGAIQLIGKAILAKVNEVPISLENLLPFGTPNADSLTLSPERLDFLLKRAIDRELIFQAARGRGVELSVEQQAELARVRETLLQNEGDSPATIHLNRTATLDEEIEFEMRDVASQQLLTSLLSAERVGAPQITEQTVRDYYQAHLGQFPALPEASNDERENLWQRIDYEIRQELALKSVAEYQHFRDAFMERLKAEAKITMLVASQ